MDHGKGGVAAGGSPLTLTREQIELRLREVALFDGLDEADLGEILDISAAVRVQANDYVYEEGERGEHFFVIVQGVVELRKATGRGFRRIAVLRAGEAFGEMALLNRTPRSASALALEDAYLLTVSRAAFSRLLGGETLAVRLLRNLSKALWAASVRQASPQADPGEGDPSQETLSEFNRMLRARILPRETPRVSGYDVTATTLAPRQGSGCTAWDWFVLPDGRPTFAVTRAQRSDIFAAQRLAAVRMLLRGFASEEHPTLGDLLTRVSRSLRAGWIEGISGPVLVGLAALSDGAAEWVEAGSVTGLLLRRSGTAELLRAHAPAVGEVDEPVYHSQVLVLGSGDRLIALTDDHPDADESVPDILLDLPASTSRDALTRILSRIDVVPGRAPGPPDVSATMITRTAPAR